MTSINAAIDIIVNKIESNIIKDLEEEDYLEAINLFYKGYPKENLINKLKLDFNEGLKLGYSIDTQLNQANKIFINNENI